MRPFAIIYLAAGFKLKHLFSWFLISFSHCEQHARTLRPSHVEMECQVEITLIGDNSGVVHEI